MTIVYCLTALGALRLLMSHTHSAAAKDCLGEVLGTDRIQNGGDHIENTAFNVPPLLLPDSLPSDAPGIVACLHGRCLAIDVSLAPLFRLSGIMSQYLYVFNIVSFNNSECREEAVPLSTLSAW
jgi:hypothetical protein